MQYPGLRMGYSIQYTLFVSVPVALRSAVNYEAGTVETTHTLSKVISLWSSFFPSAALWKWTDDQNLQE
jgi:hypothetical protein